MGGFSISSSAALSLSHTAQSAEPERSEGTPLYANVLQESNVRDTDNGRKSTATTAGRGEKGKKKAHCAKLVLRQCADFCRLISVDVEKRTGRPCSN